MPIANCYITKNVKQAIWEQFVQHWGELIEVNQKDITIHIFTDFSQYGNPYTLKAELYLPSLWSGEAIHNTQNSFLVSSEKILGIIPENTFLMTQIIQSGHVFDRGLLQEW